MERDAEAKRVYTESVFILLKHNYNIPIIYKQLEQGGDLEEFLYCCWEDNRNIEECALHIALHKIDNLIYGKKIKEALEIIFCIETLAPYLFKKELISGYFSEFITEKLEFLKEKINYINHNQFDSKA